ncbi:elongation factor Ts [Puteibacter caeruleilacunae]|nr:elongation factor Ts [Puteibacter caeruleilacunae]
MAISAADVMKLRKATGAGMMDCKKALAEAEGDFDRAVEIIREKGKAIANKRADREASEGAAIAKTSADGKTGGLVVLNCETDFVAKNDNFVAFATSILDLALANGASTIEEVKALELDGRTVEAQVTEQTGIIGEKIELSHYAKVDAESVAAYIHPGNKLATLVGFTKAGVEEAISKDVAMQVAAMNPVAIDKENVPADVVEKELTIAKEKFRAEGKPEAMLDKIAQGSLNKFFKENTLMNQVYVKDGKISIREFLGNYDKDVTVCAMERFSLNA